LTVLVGAAAGAAAAMIRLHLGLPGHKAMFWMPPLLAARLALGRGGEAIAGALAAGEAALLAGGNLGGGMPLLPLLIAVGVVLEAACALLQRWRPAPPAAIALAGLACAGANLLCSVRRIGDTLFAQASLAAFTRTAASYAFFGVLAGVAGGTVAMAIARARRGSNAGRSSK
jgi:hypothetical protein